MHQIVLTGSPGVHAPEFNFSTGSRSTGYQIEEQDTLLYCSTSQSIRLFFLLRYYTNKQWHYLFLNKVEIGFGGANQYSVE